MFGYFVIEIGDDLGICGSGYVKVIKWEICITFPLIQNVFLSVSRLFFVCLLLLLVCNPATRGSDSEREKLSHK